MSHRNRDERRRILRAIFNGATSSQLSQFGLTDDEESFFRSHALRAENAALNRTTIFSAYYRMPRHQPVWYVIILVTIIVAGSSFCIEFFLSKARLEAPGTYPLFAAASTVGAIIAAAIGWGIASWIAHRNSRVQQTMAIITTRFAQPAFTGHLSNFFSAFGDKASPLVYTEHVEALLASPDRSDREAVQSLRYIMNYYEFIASGVSRGDMDYELVKENLRGNISFFYDKCLPHIRDIQLQRPLALRHLRRLRDHFREP